MVVRGGTMTDDRPLFSDADASSGFRKSEPLAAGSTWKLMIVDDQEDVHSMTRLVLDDFTFEGRGLTFLSAFSGAEARQQIMEHPDTAVVLLDVVMESNQAGLDVARFIRNEACNQLTRIILRTGQPGQAPERTVVTELDINDYKQKTELTVQKLFTTVTTAIRSYRDLLFIEEGRRSMHLLALSVAHQVRNRTVAIAGFANLLLRKARDKGSVDTYIRTILDESVRLEEMVTAVNDYARIEAPRPEPLRLDELLEEARQKAEQRARHLEKELEWQADVLPLQVMADPVQFTRLLDALVDNAIDFCRDGRAVVRIHVFSHGEGCGFVVEDQGTGIPDDDLPHIFDPFFTRKSNGAGMGLSIARKVAEEHQWDIRVDNAPEGGVRVEVLMPAHCGEPTPAADVGNA